MNDYNNYSFDSQYAPSMTRGRYAASVFGWMALGLLVTFAVALGLLMTNAIFMVYSMPMIILILPISQLVVAITPSRKVFSLNVGVARLLFFLYSALTGVTFASLLYLYGVGMGIFVFGLTALYFGGMAAYGYFTKRDLSGFRGVLMAGLIFLIIVGFLSLFLPLSGFDRIVCFIGVAVFLGLTAYDTQKMGQFYDHYSRDTVMLQRAGVLMALQLYLDFVNMFIYLLRFMGNRRR